MFYAEALITWNCACTHEEFARLMSGMSDDAVDHIHVVQAGEQHPHMPDGPEIPLVDGAKLILHLKKYALK